MWFFSKNSLYDNISFQVLKLQGGVYILLDQGQDTKNGNIRLVKLYVQVKVQIIRKERNYFNCTQFNKTSRPLLLAVELQPGFKVLIARSTWLSGYCKLLKLYCLKLYFFYYLKLLFFYSKIIRCVEIKNKKKILS